LGKLLPSFIIFCPSSLYNLNLYKWKGVGDRELLLKPRVPFLLGQNLGADPDIWSDNSIIQRLQINSINVMSVEAKLMAIRLGLILAMEKENVHDIILITDSIIAAKKIFESKINPL